MVVSGAATTASGSRFVAALGATVPVPASPLCICSIPARTRTRPLGFAPPLLDHCDLGFVGATVVALNRLRPV